MRPSGRRERRPGEQFGQHAAVRLIVVAQAERRQHRGLDVGVIGPDRSVDAVMDDSGSDHAQPGGVDLRADVTVVPRLSGGLAEAGGLA